MKPALQIMFGFLMLVCALGSAAAERKTVLGSGVAFDVPTGWRSAEKSVDGEALVVALSPDEEASVIFAVSEAANADKAIRALDGALAKFVSGAKLQKARKAKLNGMRALVMGGSGAVNGSPVKLAVTIVETPTKKVLFVIGLVNAAKAKAYRKTLDELLAGIKPTRR